MGPVLQPGHRLRAVCELRGVDFREVGQTGGVAFLRRARKELRRFTDEGWRLMAELTETRAALAMYDEQEPRRDAMMEACNSNADVEAWQKVEDDDLMAVRHAFFWDTYKINCRDNCRIVDLHAIRVWLEKEDEDDRVQN